MTPLSSNLPPESRRLERRIWALYALLAALLLVAYALSAQATYTWGFPLDDSWIHQTYARNLALRGEWAFLPGQPSAGSTAPLWTVLLVPGQMLGIDPRVWALLLGWVGLVWVGVMGWRLTARWLTPTWAGWAAGLLLIGEWHLVWAASSGMETLLAAALGLTLWDALEAETIRGWWVGLLLGLLLWTRPDGLVWGGGVAWVWLTRPEVGRVKLRWAAWALGVFLLAAAPYLLWQQALSGEWWPTTFFAKQAEFAYLRTLPLGIRLWQLWSVSLMGVGVLLLPGQLYQLWDWRRRAAWRHLAGFVVAWAMMGVYALRMPVAYQYGRYLMPIMPLLWLTGWAGSVTALARLRPTRLAWVVRRIAALSPGLVALGFLILGARSFGRDVAYIESEMVTAARWVAANTPAEAKMATHDIGALGYFGGRELIDLAGLISPEVIPIMRDEARLADFLDRRGATYLVTFPAWYPELTRGRKPLYTTAAPYTPAAGGENLAVYRWP